MQNYNQKNPLWEKVPQFDFTVSIKHTRALERGQCQIWISLIESYQEKIQHLKKQMQMEKCKQNLTPIQQEINSLYLQSLEIAANNYQDDLIQIAKKELEDKHKKAKKDLEEQIDLAKKNFNLIKEDTSVSKVCTNKDCYFLAGASSENVLILAMKMNQNNKVFISLQVFEKNNYISHCFNHYEIQIIAIHEISDKKLVFACANENILSLHSLIFDSRTITNEQVFQKEINFNIDLLHIIDEERIIVLILIFQVINQCQGIVQIIGQNSQQILYQGGHVINESIYYSKNQVLQLSNNQRIVSIQNILNNPRYDELKTDQYSGLIYYQTNLPNFHLEYARYLQLLDDDSLLFVNSDNEIRVFNLYSRTIKEFGIPTENIEIRYLTFFPKLNKVVFCDQQGQTFQIDKLRQYFL